MNKSVTVGFRLTPVEHDELKRVSKEMGLSSASLVRMLALLFMQDKKKTA